MNLYEYVGQQIRKLRTENNLTQEQLASKLGVITNTISRWETATYQPGLKDIEKISRYFGVSIMSFFQNEQPEGKVEALMRAAQDLDSKDLDELMRYAHYRRAAHIMKSEKKTRAKA